ncbi:restriction endonuclease subunit S [Anaerovoracaceae bacterium 42-11]
MGNKKKPAIRFKGFTDDWEQRKLGEMVQFSKGTGYSKADLKEVGTPIILYGRLYTKYETVITEVDTYADEKVGSVYSQGGEVVVPASGETTEDIARASAVAIPGVLLGGDLNIITPPKNLDSAFLAISISNGKPHDDMSKMAQGKSVVHLHNIDLEKIDLMYPCYAEQKQISLYFKKIDHLITLHQRKYDKLCVMKKSMLEKMFPKNGEKVPEVRFKGFTDDWEQRKLGEVGKARSGVGFPDSEQGGTVGIPFFKVSDMNLAGNENEMTIANNYVSEEQIASHRWIPIGELPAIFFAKVGAAVMLNRKRLCRFPFLLDNNTMAYSLDRKEWNADFAKALFETVDLTSLVQVGALPSYNAGDVEALEISLPELNEQEQIGAFFQSLDHLITLHQRELEKLKNIKKSMLEKMFV